MVKQPRNPSSQISTLIRQEREHYVERDTFLTHHSEINTGCCRMFARFVRNRAADHGINVELYEAGFDASGVPSHAWIQYNGTCYDAECPDGVSDPTQLPYYQNKNITALSPSKVH